MPRLLTASSTLVLQHGQPAAATPYLALEGCERISAPGSEAIALVLEPVEESPRAAQVAEELAERLIEEIQARRAQTTTAALLAAIEMGNGWLVQLNAVRPPRERCYFGFTCVLTRDDEAYVAQAAPSQILIAQEGEIYAFPGLESWRWHTRETTDSTAVALPLGLDETQPDLYHTRLAAGDLLVLCSSSLARVIDRAPQVAFVQGDAAVALDHLDELARLFTVSDAWVAAVAVPEPARQQHQRGGDLAFLRRASSWFSHFLPEETAERLRRHATVSDPVEVDLSDEAVHTLDYTAGMTSSDVAESLYWDDARGSTAEFPIVTGAGAPPADALLDEAPKRHDADPDERYWEPEQAEPDEIPGEWERDARLDYAPESRARRRGVGMNDLVAVALLAFSAAVVGVRQITVNRDRSLGPRDDGTLGMPRLSRYDDNIQLPEFRGVRSRMPRVPLSRTVALALVILLIVFAAAVAVSVRNKHERERQAQMTALFQNAESLRQRAGESSDPAAVQNILQAASASITRAQAFGLDQDRAAREQAAISADRDQALKIDRLANIQVLGSLPAAPQGVTPRIFAGNGQIYVFTDALYRLDATGNSLVRLIGSGDQIGGQPVGTLLGAAWGDGAPLAFDGSRAFLFDPPTGTWHAQQVETLGGPETGIAAINGYSGNLYLLSPETGQIVKYGAGAYDNQPEDWTAGAGTDDLKQAVDFAIDGHIYVLTTDGRVIDFFMSAEQSTMTPHAVPPVTHALALSLQTDRPYVYIAERGRILRLERSSGNLVQQFVAGSDGPPFNDIRALSVDDVLGTAYILNGNALLSVRLPGPPH